MALRRPPEPRRGATASLRFGLVVVAAIIGVLLSPRPAFAHADIVSASPAPGTGLPQAPGAVVLKFTEPLNLKLSAIAVVDRSGRDFGKAATLPVQGDRTAMQRKLGLLRPAIYTVRWTTVSRLDGHTLHGSYAFGIGDSPLDTQRVESSPVSSEGWGGLVGRWVALAGLALWAGSIALDAVAQRAGVSAWRRAAVRWAGPALTLVGTATSVASSAWVAAGSLRAIDDVLSAGGSGTYRVVVLASAAAALLLAPAAPRRWWRLSAVVLVGAAIVAEAASGHAAATSTPVLATMSLAVHITAVGVWVYVIAASLLSSQRLSALRQFSPYAVVAALAVAATGIANAVLELNSPGELTSTTYGRVVAFKALALVVMAILGYAHYHERLRPAPALRNVRDLLRGELGGAAVALVLTTVLVGFPNPPRQEAAAEALAKPDTLRDLGGRAAVSVADGAGPFVLGLTVLPPRPGPVEVRVLVIGVQPGDGLRDARVRASAADRPATVIELQGCGLGCFKGRGQLAGAGMWRLETDITSNRGRVTMAEAIPLPTPDGTAALRRAIEAMSRLTSLRVHETLRSKTTQAPIITDYRYRAPDAFAYSISNGAAEITIGRQQYLRQTPDGPWVAQGEPPIETQSFRWPAGFYHGYWSPAVATLVLGNDTIDGESMEMVSFFRPDVTAWFKLWIDTNDGLVRRMEMRAEGHLMDQNYGAFNTPVQIAPPL